MTRKISPRFRRAALGTLGVVATVVTFLIAVPSANATAALGVTVTLPPTAAVGQTGLPGTLAITNNSTAPDDAAGITLTTIAMVPSCGSASPVGNGNCPSAASDPGVYAVTAATGLAGSACAGVAFTVKTTDPPTGRIAFTTTTPVVLTQNATCTIGFTVGVNRFPTHPVSVPSINSATTEQFVFIAGSNSLGHPASSVVSSSTTVTRAPATVVTTASGSITIGALVNDSARLSNGAAPTGTITFTLYGPNDPDCATAAFTTINNVGRGNAVYTSAAFVPTLPGTYNWIAAYSGDANNAAFSEPCGSANESVTVNQFTPTLSTQASDPVVVGGAISDSATLAGGGLTPGGTITFTAYGPDDPTCGGGAVFTSTVPVTSGNGTYASGPFTPTHAGTYSWAATYNGDVNNAAVTDACGGTNESVPVAKASPSISTQASVGNPGEISDVATVTGGLAPAGTVTFRAYGPGDPTCANAPAQSVTVLMGSNGQASSGTFVVSRPGTYIWVATYNGDADNNTATEPCGSAGESVTVPMIITTTSLPDAPVGPAYKQTLVAAGGKKAYHWAVTAGSLPPGIKLSTAGVLSGAPTTPGSYPFTVTVTDSSKPALSVSRALSLTVTPMAVATTSLADGTVGVAYKQKLTTSGGKGTLHWAVVSGALPSGVKLSAAGALTGKPTTPGTSTFTVQVTDSAKPAHVAVQVLSITIDPMTVTTASLPAGHVGVAYAAKLVSHGGVGTHHWSVLTGGLPPGVSLSASGKLSGKPTTAGSYSFTVQVSDSAKPTPNTATQGFTITVS